MPGAGQGQAASGQPFRRRQATRARGSDRRRTRWHRPRRLSDHVSRSTTRRWRPGGDSILASKGDLGQLLFSASAGLADLSQTLVALRHEADGFYKLRARSGVLSDLKVRLATLKAQREESDTFATGPMPHSSPVRDKARLHYDVTLVDRARVRARHGRDRTSMRLPCRGSPHCAASRSNCSPSRICRTCRPPGRANCRTSNGGGIEGDAEL